MGAAQALERCSTADSTSRVRKGRTSSWFLMGKGTIFQTYQVHPGPDEPSRFTLCLRLYFPPCIPETAVGKHFATTIHGIDPLEHPGLQQRFSVFSRSHTALCHPLPE